MAANFDAVAAHLFEGVMAPLVLGGSMRPDRVIGLRVAVAIGTAPLKVSVAPELLGRVEDARVRRARMLLPIDRFGLPTAAEWTLAAALHDILQCANPRLNTTLRRGAAARLAKLAGHTIDQVAPPTNLHEALSRHAWFARVLDIARTDTAVSWWSESRVFLGVEPPSRVQAWPRLRRVRVTRTSRPFLELSPLPVERAILVRAVSDLLTRTPLTDLATCTRATPPFAWRDATLALIATRSGMTLVMRALSRLPAADVDAALGRATRDAIAEHPRPSGPVLNLLAERAIAEALGHAAASDGALLTEEALFARSLGASEARKRLEAPDSPWPERERRALLGQLA